MEMVYPSTQPSSRKPWKNGSNLLDCGVPGSNVRKQSRGILPPGCASATTGAARRLTLTARRNPRRFIIAAR